MRRIIYKIAKAVLFWALRQVKKLADKNNDGKITISEIRFLVNDARKYLLDINKKT